MKKLFSKILMSVMLSICVSSYSQAIFNVPPGDGTLNEAIVANGGSVIYHLQAGEWYGLSGPIENVDYHLQIIGDEPITLGGKPATIQTGYDANSATFSNMFAAKGDITLRNIYLVNADGNKQVGNICVRESKEGARITIDRCILHPAGVWAGVLGDVGGIKTYFTNNQVINHGHQLNTDDGFLFKYETSNTVGLDSLFVENNTFVCIGMSLFMTDYASQIVNYVNFNHNTFVMTKSQLDWSVFKLEEFWTNNLMFDVQTQPYSYSWKTSPGFDPTMPKTNLIFAAPLKGEVFPSVRPNFVQYNSHYRAQGFYDLITELNAFAQTKQLPKVYLFPLVWSKDSLNCREAQMFNSTDFPKFKYGNTITDIDPQWNDPKIYEHEANFIKWTKPANYIHAMGQPSTNYPPASQWTQYWWIPSGDISTNSVWPVFNGKYSNPQTLIGSIENLPLGDLNWFPESKAIWQSKKAIIDAHIKAGNTSKINLTGISEFKDQSIAIYPNPAKSEILIKGVQNAEVTIMSLDGRALKAVKNVTKVNVSDIANGSYLISIIEGNRISTQKLLIER